LEILGGCKEISKSIEYRSEMNELESVGLIECYNNHCTVTPKGKDLYERFKNEKNTIENILRDYYRTSIKDVDMKDITSRALDNLLKFVETYGFPEPTRNTDPLIKMLFIDNPKSFTARILGTQYALPLLILYDYTLSCEINEKCKNHYPSGKTIIRILEDHGIYKQKVLLIPLINSGLIEKVSYGNNKYKLTQLGIYVAKHSALQAYITFKI
jgi:predicted transcriptional regulator